MRKYGTVVPSFWRGQTGREIRALGQAAQLVAVYLMTSPNSNLIGLYYLPLPTLAHETNCTEEEARLILNALEALEWAYYDPKTETVWVRNMAFYQVAEEVKQKDKRWPAIVQELVSYDKSPFFKRFLDLYGEPFQLRDAFQGALEGLGSPLEAPSKPLQRVRRKITQAPSKPLPRGSEGPMEGTAAQESKPLGSPSDARNKEQGTGARNKEQEQGTRGAKPPQAPPPAAASANEGLPEWMEAELQGIGIRLPQARELASQLGVYGLRCALYKLRNKTTKDNPAGLLVRRAKELAQEGEAILRQELERLVRLAPGALEDPKWMALPSVLREDMEAQLVWCAWRGAQEVSRTCSEESRMDATAMEYRALGILLDLLEARHPDRPGLRARMEASLAASPSTANPGRLRRGALMAALWPPEVQHAN